LPSPDPNIPIRNAPRERIDESSLADSWFSRNEYDLTFSRERLVEPASHPQKCVVASDYFRWRICCMQPRTRSPVISPDIQIFYDGRRAVCDRTYKAVPPAMSSFNEARKLGIIAKNFTDLLNNNFENRFADKSSGPHGVEEFFFGDKLAGMFEKIVEHREGFRPELYGL
jgi:hypothetical protein